MNGFYLWWIFLHSDIGSFMSVKVFLNWSNQHDVNMYFLSLTVSLTCMLAGLEVRTAPLCSPAQTCTWKQRTALMVTCSPDRWVHSPLFHLLACRTASVRVLRGAGKHLIHSIRILKVKSPFQRSVMSDGVEIPIHLIGDASFPLKPWLMKGYCQEHQLSPEQRRFTYTLNSARSVVDTAFTRLKGRWRCLLKKSDIDVSMMPRVVAACCVLHNICEIRGDSFLPEWNFEIAPSGNYLRQPETEPYEGDTYCTAEVIRDIVTYNLLTILQYWRCDCSSDKRLDVIYPTLVTWFILKALDLQGIWGQYIKQLSLPLTWSPVSTESDISDPGYYPVSWSWVSTSELHHQHHESSTYYDMR